MSASTRRPDAFSLGPALLFCPADRPDRYHKAAERADAVILDLEDAVAPADRADARAAMLANRLDPARTIVRVSPAGTADHSADLATALAAGYRLVMLAKAEHERDVAALVRAAARHDSEHDAGHDAGHDAHQGAGRGTGPARAPLGVLALCETASGVLAAPAIAALPAVVALMWGAEDLLASLGGSSSRDAHGRYRAVAAHARSAVLLAAAAHGRAAIDAVHLDIDDGAGLAGEAADAAASGFAATACIHPGQVDVIRAAYRPGEEELRGARELLAAAAGQHGVFRYRGRMVDEPVLRHARAVLSRA